MSFSDLMSSGRGPGVIGMVLASIVLLGFGALLSLGDVAGIGGGKPIASVIAEQAKEIESRQLNVDNGNKQLALIPGKLEVAKNLSRTKLENETRKTRIAELNKKVEAAKGALAQAGKDFEDYKDSYRAFARGKAKGETMPELKTLTGAIYKNVIIREVTAIGIQIRHDEGHKRIGFEELSDDMKDRFQFDPKQKAAAMAAEASDRDDHEAAVAAANVVADQQMAEQRVKDAAAAKEKTRLTIASKEAQIQTLNGDVANLQREQDRAAQQAAAARAAGHMVLDKTGSLGGAIRAKQNRIAEIQSEIARLKASL